MDPKSLTGIWQGSYTYPQGLAVQFVATLIESGSTVTGSVHEPCTLGQGEIIYATLLGHHDGSAVDFVKTYDGSNPNYTEVSYEGTLNGDATEIEGRWIIRGIWSGKFLMIRPRGNAKAVKRKARAKA